jgi:hypothetical protein
MFRSDECFVSSVHLLVSTSSIPLLSYLPLPLEKSEVRRHCQVRKISSTRTLQS